MFAPYCPVHRSRVLLFGNHIESLVNTDRGIDVYYRCDCGHPGVWHTGRASR